MGFWGKVLEHVVGHALNLLLDWVIDYFRKR